MPESTASEAKTAPGPLMPSTMPAPAGAAKMLKLSIHAETTFVAVSSSGTARKGGDDRGLGRPSEHDRPQNSGPEHIDGKRGCIGEQGNRCRADRHRLCDVPEHQDARRAMPVGEHAGERREHARGN